ncbi:MAG: hypothetical protein WCO57_14790 [Verrucomicrobiota bacterium]
MKTSAANPAPAARATCPDHRGAGILPAGPIFDSLRLWLDPVQRPGPEAMAVDQWLLETATAPVLRVYGWSGAWASVGYFGKLDDARAALHGVRWVRRWTGGGAVDHRADWTYSVVAPASTDLANMRGAESFRRIHLALAEALRVEGMAVRLSAGDEQTGAALCFENPVGHDLVRGDGQKLAGAGQRRTRHGLLHQGSVAAACDDEASKNRAVALASKLAAEWQLHDFQPPAEVIANSVESRYGREQGEAARVAE